MSKASKAKARMAISELLNRVDYDYLENRYEPTRFGLMYMNFVKMLNAGRTDLQSSPAMHYMMADAFASDDPKVVNLCHRGAAKTTINAENMALFIPVIRELPGIGLCDVCLYVSDSMENGCASFLNNVRTLYEGSEYIRKLIPQAKFIQDEIILTNAKKEKFHFVLLGCKSGVRGVKRKGRRPRLAVIDDVVSNEDARSPTLLRKIKETIYKDIEYAMEPKSKVVLLGTPFGEDDPIIEAVESGEYKVNVFPVCEDFPVSKKDFRGSWPERMPYEWVKQKYDQAVALNQLASFNQELMLRINDENSRIITDGMLRWFDTRDVTSKRGSYTWFVTSDFAVSARGRADRTVLNVWAVDKNMDFYLVDGICERQGMDKTFDDIFRLVNMYEARLVGVEVSGQQGGFLSLLRREMDNRKSWFTIATNKTNGREGIPAINNKMSRLNLVVPLFGQGKIYLPKNKTGEFFVANLLSEVKMVTHDGIMSKHDDSLDALSQIMQMNIPLPSGDVAAPEKKMGGMSPIWGEAFVDYDDVAVSDYVC